MKKLLNLFEQRIQVITLLLGLAYVGYMAWTYLVSTPVKVVINNQELTPGEIESTIAANAAQPLEAKMSDTHVPPDLKEPRNYVDEFASKMTYKEQGNAKIWENAIVILPPANMTVDAPKNPGQDPKTPQNNPKAPVENLPTIAASKITGLTSGRTNVQVPPPGGNGNVVNADKNWVTTTFEIDPAAIARAYDAEKIPQAVGLVTFLQVVLERQELKSDGVTWGEPTVIAPLAFLQLQAFPGAGAPQNVAQGYIAWAQQHIVHIVQPPFYTPVKGDMWTYFGAPLAAVAAAPVETFDPNLYVDTPQDQLDKMNLTSAQKQAIYTARQKKKQEEAKAKRGTTPPRPTRPPPGGGGEGGGIGYGPNDPDRPSRAGDKKNPGMFLAPEVTDVPAQGAGGYNPEMPAPPQMGGEGAGIAPVINAPPLPQGEFDPHKWVAEHPATPMITGWAHDETAEPAHVYRYRITYKIKNPIFAAIGVAKTPALAQQFFIESAASEWSDKVEIISSLNFWVSRMPSQSKSNAPVMVFRWQGGESKAKEFTVTIGDVIGGKDGAVDYTTGWTLVDVRDDPRGSKYVLLMDPAGNVHKREVSADINNENFQKMKKEVEAAAAPPPTALAQ